MDTLVLRCKVYGYGERIFLHLQRIFLKMPKQPIGGSCVTVAKRCLLMDAQTSGGKSWCNCGHK